MAFREINGRVLAHRHRPGVEPALVFANGLGSDQSAWDAVIAALPRGRAALTWDLPGHGGSPVAGEVSVEEMATDMVTLIDALGIGSAVVCGVSLGGMIALAASAARPDVVRGAVLMNTAPRIGSAEMWADRIARVESGGMDAVAPEVLETWLGPDAPDPATRAGHGAMLVRTAPAGYAAACAALRDADLTGAVPDRPVLCVAGARDRAVPPDAVAAMAEAIPGARLETLPGHHMPGLEAPEDLSALIADFAADIDRPDGQALRRAILGDAHVDRAEAARSPFTDPFQDLIAEGAWGRVWASDAIPRRERSMVTLALLAALGNWDEIPMHVRATRATGASADDIREAFQHVAIYAGVPRANHALKLAERTLADMAAE
ncbi:MAG: 4-carboxymuconolactone decarboxylase [Pseudomonadota bacterium]